MTAHRLGTSIVRAIATRHEATIDVDSAEGRGSHFTVGFPLRAEVLETSTPAPDFPVAAGPRRKARVLLVDDDRLVLDTHEEILREAGHSVTALASGAEALAHLAGSSSDLVITDLSMPEMSGLDLARAIKRDFPAAPVVMLTGWSVGEQEPEILAAVDQVVNKPCTFDHLIEIVDRAVERRPEF